jgi:hypothetical protein
MFRAPRAHHQERQTVSTQPLVTVTLCWWPCRVQVGSLHRKKFVHHVGHLPRIGRIRSMKNPKGAIANRARHLPARCAPDTLCGTCYYVTTLFFRSAGSVAGIMATGWTI